MPGWGAFRACLLLAAGETESWASCYLSVDIGIVDASVRAEVINAQDGVTIFEVLAPTAITFAAGVPQALSAMGGAPWTPAAANKHAVLRVRVSGGTPAVESFDTFWACPVIDFPDVTSVLAPDTVDGVEGTGDGGSEPPTFTVPGLAVADDGDGSVTCTVTNNAGQVSQLYYRRTSVAAWTLHSTTRTGNGTITDLTGLTDGAVYVFQLVPYDSVSGAYGKPSLCVHIRMVSTGGAYTTFLSDLHTEISTSSALAAEVTDTAADHCKLGRFLWKGPKTEEALLACGPVVYVEPMPYSKSPRTADHARDDFAARVLIFYRYDQSDVVNQLTEATDFNEALTGELLSMADGADPGTPSWLTAGGRVVLDIDGPREVEGRADILATVITVRALWVEAV